MLPPWLRQLFKQRFVAQKTAPIRSRLLVEPLEDRTVLSTYTWTGNAIALAGALVTVSAGPPQTAIHNDRWSNPLNWTSNNAPLNSPGIPQPGDDVVFPFGLDAAHKPPSTGQASTFAWAVNSEIDLYQDSNGIFRNFQINNLTILDDNYHIDYFVGDTPSPPNDPTATPNLTITGEIRSSIPVAPGPNVGLSQIGPLVGTSPLNILLTGNSQSLRADGPGVLKISSPIGEDTALSGGQQVGLIKNGLGLMEISGANSFTGLVTVNQGTLLIANQFALGDSAVGTIVNNGATLAITGAGSISSAGPTTLFATNGVADSLQLVGTGVNGVGALFATIDQLEVFDGGPPAPTDSGPSVWAGNVNLLSGASIGVDTAGPDSLAPPADHTLEITGQVTGGGSLTKVGTGTLILANNNAYTGQTLIQRGQVDITSNGSLSDVGGNTVVSAGASLAVFGDLTVNENLQLNGDGDTRFTDSSGNLPGALRLISPGARAIWTGSVSMLSNSSIGVSNSNTLGFNTTMLTITGQLGGAFDLSKVDQGTLRLPNANPNFGGNTTVRNGVLDIGDALALGSTIQKSITVLNTQNVQGTLQLEGTYTIAKNLQLNGSGYNSLGALRVFENPVGTPSNITWSAPIAFQSQTSIRVDPVSLLKVTGVISGNVNTSNVDKFGLGTLELANNNTYQGTTAIREGTVLLDTPSGLGGINGGTSVTAGASLIVTTPLTVTGENLTLSGIGVNALGAFQTPAGLTTWTGGVVLNGVNSTEADINVAPNGVLNFTGVLSGDADLRKIGTGELRLTGSAPNQFVKTTFLDQGTIALGKILGAGLTGGALGGSIIVGDNLGGDDADVLRLDASNQIPDALSLIIRESGRFNLNNKNETLGGLTAVSVTGGTISTGTGVLTLSGNFTAAGSGEQSRIDGTLNLGGVSRVFAFAATPALALTSNRNAATAGTPVTFVLTALANPGIQTPTGSVQFYDNGSPIGVPQSVTGGSAQVTTSTLTAGTHVITANYLGDANYPPASIVLSPNQVIVNPQVQTLFTVSSNPATPTQQVTFTYKVFGPASTVVPTGTVTITDQLIGAGGVVTQTTVLGTVPLTLGVGSLPVAALPSGQHRITATYNGDATYSPTTTTLSPILFVGQTPVTAINSNASPALLGQAVTFSYSAVGAGGGGVPTGTVQFFANGVQIGTPVLLDAGGLASYTTVAGDLPRVGSYTITANYSGDGFYVPAITTLAPQLKVVNPIVFRITANTDPTTAGTPVIYTIMANGLTGQPAVQGSMRVFASLAGGARTQIGSGIFGQALGNLPAVPGVAYASGTIGAVGSYNITADYFSLNGNYANHTLAADKTPAVTLTPPPESVVATNSLFVLSSSNNVALPTENITFRLSSPSAVGTVQFFNGATLLRDAFTNQTTFLLNRDAFNNVVIPTDAVITIAPLPAGQYTITARFTQTAANVPSQTIRLQPDQFVARPISGVLTANTSTAALTQPVTFTYRTVTLNSPPAGVAQPIATGGIVTFKDGGNTLATVPLVNGVATFTTTTLSRGPRNITAQWSGNSGLQYGPETEILTPILVVAGNPLQAVLTSSSNASRPGDLVTLTFTALGNIGQAPATGSVQFFDNGSPIGVAQNLIGSIATVSTNALTYGVHNITAQYTPYPGDLVYFATTTTQGPSQVVLDPTTIQVSTDAPIDQATQTPTQQVGAPVTFSTSFTTTFDPAFPSTPTGTVTFFYADPTTGLPVQIGTVQNLPAVPAATVSPPFSPPPPPQTVTRIASVTTNTLPLTTPGNPLVITAVYSGDPRYQPISLQVTNQQITPTPPPPLSPPATSKAAQQPILQVNGTIAGTAAPGGGAPGIIKTGTGQLVLNAPSTYTGPTVSNGTGGSIVLGANNVLPNSDLIITAGTVDLNGKTQTVKSLSGAAAGILALSSGSLTVGESNASTTYAGVITGAGSLTKVGTGTLTLSGTSPAFTGAVVIAAGTVLVNGTQANSSTLVGAGTTLGGTGTAGTVSVSTGGTVAPGATPVIGTLSATSVTFNGGTFAVDLSKVGNTQSNDLLALNTLIVGSANPILLLSTAAYNAPLLADSPFTILSTTAPLPPAFRFNRPDGTVINNGGTLVAGGRAFTITYDTVGNTVKAQFIGFQTVGTFTASANPVSPGDTVTFTVTFARSSPSDPVPQGTVTFSDSIAGTTFVPVTVALNAGGVATTTATFGNAAVGTHTITATFTASSNNYINTTATTTELVNIATATTLTTSSASVVFGQTITFTAKVTGAGGTPTGTVSFVNAATGAVLGTTGLDGTGTATFATTGLTTGRYTIQAVYNGDPTYRISTATVGEVVAAKPLVAVAGATGGTVAVYDPQTNTLLGQGNPFGNYAGGVKVATGDVNGDGFADLVLLAGPGSQLGHVQILNGRPGAGFAPLADYQLPTAFGELNVAVGDVNGDGKADVVVSTATDFDYVAVFSGSTQTAISRFAVFGGLRLGVSLAVGDFDGDGKADIYAGTGKPFDGTGFGAALIFNGTTGNRMGTYLFALASPAGVSVAAADVNGDGKFDVAIGSLSPFGGLGPVVGVYDAAGSQGLIKGFLAYPGQPVGVRLSATDRNGDGRQEIVTTFTGGVTIGAYYTFDPNTNSFNLLDGFAVNTKSANGLNVAGSV